jgi:hypothetical protein
MSDLRLGTAGLARGTARLAFDAVEQLTRVVEGMHANIAAGPAPLGRGTDGRRRGVSGLVYRTIRLVNSTARGGIDHGLAWLPAGEPRVPSRQGDALRSVLNGVVGDHLAASSNPLAIPMGLRHAGRQLPSSPPALSAALPAAGPRLLVLVHGLCMNERQWLREGHDHGAALGHALGMTPVYVRYNSGRPISENGRELSALLEQLRSAWPAPLDDVTILAHSMGGLVARSAIHEAEERRYGWRDRLRSAAFLGTPHHGAPLERAGSWVEGALGWSPYTAPLARLGMLRSAGITDLRYGSIHPADLEGRDRFARRGDTRRPVPLPADVACFALAASLGNGAADPKHLVGDGLVPLASALGRHEDPGKTLDFPKARRWVGRRMGHFDLLSSRDAAAQLIRWLR